MGENRLTYGPASRQRPYGSTTIRPRPLRRGSGRLLLHPGRSPGRVDRARDGLGLPAADGLPPLVVRPLGLLGHLLGFRADVVELEAVLFRYPSPIQAGVALRDDLRQRPAGPLRHGQGVADLVPAPALIAQV